MSPAHTPAPNPGPGAPIFGDETVRVPLTRDVPLPEPVDTAWLNGRPPGGWLTEYPFTLLPPVGAEWEEAAIRAARERERAREWRP